MLLNRTDSSYNSYLSTKLNLLIVSLTLNVFFLVTIGFFGVKYYQLYNNLVEVNTNFLTFQLEVDQKFTLLNQQLLVLNAEKALPAQVPWLSGGHSAEYNSLLLKVTAIAVLLFLVSLLAYYLSTSFYSFFFKTSIVKLVTFINTLGLKLLGLVSSVQTNVPNVINFHELGYDFIVTVAADGNSAAVAVRGIGMDAYIPIAEYLTRYGPTLFAVPGGGGIPVTTLNLLESAAGAAVNSDAEIAALLEYAAQYF